MQTPPSPTDAKRLIFWKDRPSLSVSPTKDASSRNKRPLRRPLPRTVVAHPRTTPDITRNISCTAEGGPDTGTLLTKSRKPKNDSNAKVLSPYGADKNMPAGEIICKQPAMKPNWRPDGPGNTARAKWYKTITDKPCEAWAMVAPTKLSREEICVRAVPLKSATH